MVRDALWRKGNQCASLSVIFYTKVDSDHSPSALAMSLPKCMHTPLFYIQMRNGPFSLIDHRCQP